MFTRLVVTVLIVAWVAYNIHASDDQNEVLLITCTIQKANLNYTTSLPSSECGNTVTTTARDHGTWAPCTVAGVYVSVRYDLSVILTNANCKQAIFTQLLFYGFFNFVNLTTGNLVNFTIDLSDPSQIRFLNQTQIFKGRVRTPYTPDLPPPANITFTFQGDHGNNCEEVDDEQTNVNPNVYLLNIGEPVPGLPIKEDSEDN
ncbi:unnamed protein product [Adineta steineri]|uniref:Uncharacterized protein n=1 Tax=Adineta steineri TaxID=433720 RepID=A0A813X542_9BILA|nr:unnamed protein product [Adineta steineri]CAF4020804.1 unnamed protein product [Adineta steineri]